MRRILTILAMAVVAALPTLVARIVVCPLCGREAQPAAAACGHCGAGLKPEGATAPVADDVPDDPADVQEHVFREDGKLAMIGLKTVRAEFALGQRMLAEDREDVAREFFRNALALESLAVADREGGKRAEAMRARVKGTETYNRDERHVCPACGGTRTRTIKHPTFSGGFETREVKYEQCPRCGVRGFVVRPGTVANWLARLEEGRRRHAELQERRGWVRSGLAWVPPELKDRLTVRQQAAVNRILATPCSGCGGVGQTDCRACAGLGEVNCRQCEMGFVSVVDGGRLSKHKVTRADRCKACAGRGSLRCKPCAGQGRSVCARCKGTGQRPVCGRCDGTGVAECRRCDGAGTLRDEPCAACGGEGVALCSACRGEGRTR